MEYILELSNIKKEINNNIIVNDINIKVKKGEFLTLLGPSGCGKTTLLRLMGGFDTPTTGEILFESKNITNIPANKRPFNTVFQKYALFPHMNIFNNIAFGLHMNNVPKSIVEEKVKNILKLVRLENYQNRYPQSLSGGQQQRVAIARALVNEPDILLLDEPLGALDLKLRKELQGELKTIQRTLGITFVFVTHDQEEALSLSDQIIVLKEGKIQQIGSPVDIYNEPENAFIADFIGESNIIQATMKEDFLVHFCHHDFQCLDKGFALNEEVDIVIRPEDITLVPFDEKEPLSGIVKSILFIGVHYEMIVESHNYNFLVHSTDASVEGTKVSLTLEPDDIHVMSKENV